MNTKVKVANLQETRDIFPLEAREIISGEKGREDIVVLDVCTRKEFETSPLEGAVHINYFSKLFKSRLDILDRDKTYLVYCRMGGRSKLAQKAMVKLGFKRVYNIVGGTHLWEEEGLPFATRKFITAAYGASLNVLKEVLIGNKSRTAEGKERYKGAVEMLSGNGCPEKPSLAIQ